MEGGSAFFDTRIGNEIGSRPSRIPTPGRWGYPIAFSPDGKWIVIQPEGGGFVDLLNVKTRTRVKTIEIKSEDSFEHVTCSADGEKVMVIIVRRCHRALLSEKVVFIWDVKTDTPLKQLVVQAGDVAISPNGSQIAIHNELGIEIIDVSTTGNVDHRRITLCNDGSHWTRNNQSPRIAWSPNGQFLASSTTKESRTKLYLLSLTRGSAQVPIQVLTQVECPTKKYVSQLTFSPDSSKVVALLWDSAVQRMTLSIWCTRSGALVGTSHEMNIGFAEFSESLSFVADGQDILICDRVFSSTPPNSTLYRFSVAPMHLETYYMNDPPKFHPSQTPHTIQYSHHISGLEAIDDYASHVTTDGWILNTKGECEIWTPWANYELLCSCKPPQKGRTQYRTLEVKDPQTKTVVMIYVIAFEQENVK